jgi:hypothetical protein
MRNRTREDTVGIREENKVLRKSRKMAAGGGRLDGKE